MAVQAQHTCQGSDEKCGEPVASVSAITVTEPLMVRSNGRATIEPPLPVYGRRFHESVLQPLRIRYRHCGWTSRPERPVPPCRPRFVPQPTGGQC